MECGKTATRPNEVIRALRKTMAKTVHLFKTGQPTQRRFLLSDGLILVGLVALLYAGVRLALDSPQIVRGPEITLNPAALPGYTALSLGRMAAAYALSLAFTLFYGRVAANHPGVEKVLIPLLDVLQSVPILSFLPVVLLGLSVYLPVNVAAELASIVLIFTSQVWNLTFSWYQSLTSLPKETREASAIFRLNSWLRFRRLELPFAIPGLVWNSMLSWAGGWFFLMAAEIFTVGNRDFRLPGLGAYLHEAANQGDTRAISWGLVVLVLVIITLDQLVWRPLMAWAERFKIGTLDSEAATSSWFFDLLHNARLVSWLEARVLQPVEEAADQWSLKLFPFKDARASTSRKSPVRSLVVKITLAGLLGYGIYRAGGMLWQVSLNQWKGIGVSLMVTLGRVLLALALALLWTIPIGTAIGTNRRLAAFLQPVVQVMASIPVTALFPVFLLFLLHLPGGLNLVSVLVMLLGTQWYLLFNVIAGANAIPQDLKYTTQLMHLNRWQRWRILIFPALFPYVVTGAITATGGAWNASIVAEHVNFAGQIHDTIGIGASIAEATASGNYALLLAATLSMVVTVVVLNRSVWRRLYQLSAEKYQLE